MFHSPLWSYGAYGSVKCLIVVLSIFLSLVVSFCLVLWTVYPHSDWSQSGILLFAKKFSVFPFPKWFGCSKAGLEWARNKKAKWLINWSWKLKLKLTEFASWKKKLRGPDCYAIHVWGCHAETCLVDAMTWSGKVRAFEIVLGICTGNFRRKDLRLCRTFKITT